MVRFEGITFEGQPITLDGHEYIRCQFRGCQIVVRAAQPSVLIGCLFVNCQWVLDGPAKGTLELLRGLYETPPFGPEIVEPIIEYIRGQRDLVVSELITT